MKKFLVGLIVIITIILLVLIQINLLNVITFAGVAANIGIVVTTAMGLLCGKEVGTTVGGIYGLIIDIIFGKSLGFYFLLYMILGFCCGMIGRGFSKDNKTTLVVMVGVATILFEILSYGLGMIIYNYNFAIFSILIFAIKEAIYNILIGVILFKPLTLLAEIINKSKNSYYLL